MKIEKYMQHYWGWARLSFASTCKPQVTFLCHSGPPFGAWAGLGMALVQPVLTLLKRTRLLVSVAPGPFFIS